MNLIFLPNYGEGKVHVFVSFFINVFMTVFTILCSVTFNTFLISVLNLSHLFLFVFCLFIYLLHDVSNDHLKIQVFRDVMLLGELLPTC